MFDYNAQQQIPAQVQQSEPNIIKCTDLEPDCGRRVRTKKQLVIVQLNSPELNLDDLENGYEVPLHTIESLPVELKDYWDQFDIKGIAIKDSLEYRFANNINWEDCYEWQMTLIPVGNKQEEFI